MYHLKDIHTVFCFDHEEHPWTQDRELLDISELTLNHILDSNCYNDVDELDLSRLTYRIDCDEDTLTILSAEDGLPVFPPERLSLWRGILTEDRKDRTSIE